MVSTENKIFVMASLLVAFGALMLYLTNSNSTENQANTFVSITIISNKTIEQSKSTTTNEISTTFLQAITTKQSTVVETIKTTVETILPTTTEELILESTTSATSVTTLPSVDYLSSYRNKGYRQAYMNITFFCPSCVPAVSANLRNTPGVIAKSMSYKQRVSWVIYNPELVSLDKVFQLSTANGEGLLLNDSLI